jgi:hypothetical protein
MTTAKQRKRKSQLAAKAAALVDKMGARLEKQSSVKVHKETLKHLY